MSVSLVPFFLQSERLNSLPGPRRSDILVPDACLVFGLGPMVSENNPLHYQRTNLVLMLAGKNICDCMFVLVSEV